MNDQRAAASAPGARLVAAIAPELTMGFVRPSGLRSIAARLRLDLVGLPEDEGGILPDALEATIRARRPKALFLNPTLRNPTTHTIPADRRAEIAAVLVRQGSESKFQAGREEMRASR